jgi:hypothetical protein
LSQLLPRYRPDDSGDRVSKAVGVSETAQAGPGAAGGGWRHLRGLPVLTYGVGGAMLGTRPEREVLKLDRRKF